MHIVLVHNVEIEPITLKGFLGKLTFPGFILTRCCRLQSEVAVYFKLRPYQISLLVFLRKSPPTSPFDYTSHQLRIVASTHIHLHLHFLGQCSEQQAVGEGYLPDEIFIVIPLKWNHERFRTVFCAVPSVSGGFFHGLSEFEHHFAHIYLA